MRKLVITVITALVLLPYHTFSQELNAAYQTMAASVFEEDMGEQNEPERTDIKTKTFSKIKGAPAGYYLIANTYSKKKYRDRFIKDLNKRGLHAHFITNQKEGLSYVCVNHHTNWNDAVADYDSGLQGKYDGELWVLIIEKDNDTKVEKAKVPVANGQAKLIKRANEYYDMMWYKEAAKYYDLALEKNAALHSKEVLQRAGDSHYFNSNMEKAHHWYHMLYENHKDEITSDNLFKYAHALKGNSKYGRAKRMMRLYKKRLKEEGRHTSRNIAERRETVLDEILGNTEETEVKNLAINSRYSDFSPMFYGQDKMVYASAKDSGFLNTRRYKWNNQPYLDLYVAKINERSKTLDESKKLSKKINTKYHEASVTFSPDGSTMFFTRNNTKGKKVIWGSRKINYLKIYRSDLIDGEWTQAKELPFNSDEFSTGHPALSPDGKLLYFVSDRPGTIGKTDIFVVDVNDDGTYSEPRNLGPEINTKEREMFPFVNDEKLYFSSDGHIGLGGLDIFEAVRSDTGFDMPKNLGKPINSSLDDFSFIIREETQEGYFASNRKGGKGDDDIYSFKRLQPEEAVNLNAITGTVTELITGDVMPSALVELLDENNIKLAEAVTGEDGTFLFEDLEGNTQYMVRVKKDEFFEKEQSVSTLDNELVTSDVGMKRLKEMIAIEDGVKKLKTDMIHFDFDKSYIRTDAAEELNKLVEIMEQYPTMVIKIESHTDKFGPSAYNKYLSDKRAKSTRDYLISKGIDASRIASAVGYGEEQPLNECTDGVRCSREKHQQNRRSEFIIVDM
ncbi:OmpA family protein [Allomuricauda sp. SCSIO 65647]|uniref:OmpA family protein n=1 Tax=Allomuricauda sp. SCSIO 65647 TaxID=2908843 RepID=UPI001F403EC9|nr:OmpA family protein [Muricauda sp. SCSIO 65647]UJH69052.1 OmpA family protein [Muricauda sp. SCSIO 65647]